MSDWTRCLAGPTLHERRRALPRVTSTGRHQDRRPLIGEADLPDRVELVWHGVNDRANLRHFLASPVRWGECDVRRDPKGRLALRHDPFGDTIAPAPGGQPAGPLLADEFLRAALTASKGVKLDIKQPEIADELLELVAPDLGAVVVEDHAPRAGGALVDGCDEVGQLILLLSR